MIDKYITVVIPTSPSFRHPSTAMIRETIRLVRLQLPKARILITVDGIRDEQSHLAVQYKKYKKNLYQWVNKQDKIDVMVFSDFQHQSGMIRRTLPQIKTPLLLYIEHDFPIVGDIDWPGIVDILLDRRVDLVRFYLEPDIIPEHMYLFLDQRAVNIGGVPLLRTGQWSQRPHIARKDFYKRIIDLRFTKDSRTYIEDGVHGYTGEQFSINRSKAWRKNRMAVYYPEGDIGRCIHLDGRGDEAKYEMVS